MQIFINTSQRKSILLYLPFAIFGTYNNYSGSEINPLSTNSSTQTIVPSFQTDNQNCETIESQYRPEYQIGIDQYGRKYLKGNIQKSPNKGHSLTNCSTQNFPESRFNLPNPLEPFIDSISSCSAPYEQDLIRSYHSFKKTYTQDSNPICRSKGPFTPPVAHELTLQIPHHTIIIRVGKANLC